MAPRTAAIRPTCCCLNVRIATTTLAIYHVVSVWAGLGRLRLVRSVEGNL